MKTNFLIIPLLAVLVFSVEGFSQQKQLWAKSYINEKAPALNIKTWLSEVPVTEEKFVLVDFWATWCGPCKKGIPKLNAISRKF
ncbi:MAG: thioredoxin domain-containing protein, partial [Bacteroidota bacterium]